MKNFILKSKSSDSRGFSLVELMIAMTIVLIMLGILASILKGINYQFRTQRPRLEAINNGQTAVDTVIRLARMAGNRPLTCPSTFQVLAPTPSVPLGGGNFGALRIQSDWNPVDCALTGVEEDVTFSVKNGVLYLDAAQLVPFVDRVSALRFQFYDNQNVLITDAQTRTSDIAFIRVELDTLATDGTSPTIISGAALRK
jgi:prepilin-type N-terminal cleavage/methylation domain-containing protein